MGDGSLYMSNSHLNLIDGFRGTTFINNLTPPADIEGAGRIATTGHVQLENLGKINATYPENALVIGFPSVPIANAGVLEATTGTLELYGTYQNTGSIEANGGIVLLHGCTIAGGTLSNSSSGVINPYPGFAATLDGVTNEAFYQLNSGSRTILKGTITNNGQFQMNDTTGEGTSLTVNDTATLKGSGIVTVSAGSKNTITGSGHFINKETIQGPITVTVAKVSNGGIFQDVTGTNFPLTIQLESGGFNNIGGKVASNGGSVNLLGPGTFLNAGGAIDTDGLIVADDQPMVVGGGIIGAGTFEGKKVILDGSQKDPRNALTSVVTNSATLLINAGDITTFKGGFTNNGIVQMTAQNCSPCPNATAVISGNVSVTGTGMWNLFSVNGFTSEITGSTGNDTLINNSTIQGTGIIGNNSMNLVNAFKGQILANSSLLGGRSTGVGVCHSFRLREIFHREHLPVALRHADACGIHVAIQDVGAVLGRLHEAVVNGGWVWALVHIFGKPGKVCPGCLRAGGQTGLAGKLMRDCSLLCHPLGMLAGGVGQGFIRVQRQQSVRLPLPVHGVE
jgi:hypothetical protein